MVRSLRLHPALVSRGSESVGQLFAHACQAYKGQVYLGEQMGECILGSPFESKLL